ncbi:organic solvent tolerance protein [Pelagibacterales bacterium SAG-MED06]|nr:organic solvent tolerance protein [Pelagibacterales bacterium SAG-MED06]
MRNKLKNYILVFFCFFLLSKNVCANEPFVFNVTEIEILESGNQINGYKGGTATSEDGSIITAENFFYNKLTNILETSGNVKYLDKIKNIVITTNKAIYLKNEEKIFTIDNSKAVNDNNTITASNLEYDKINNIFKAEENVVVTDLEKDTTIYANEITYFKNDQKTYARGNSKAVNDNNTITASNLEYDKINNIFKAEENVVVTDLEKDTTIYANEITYFKNDEKVFTKGKTKALIEKKYAFNSENVSYFRNSEDIFSQKKSSLEDENGNFYKLDSFSYNINEELLKGKNVTVLAKVEKNNIDQYFFSEGFFNFKDKSHIAKETKIKIHKEVFGDENQDPRIYGSSSLSDQNKTVVNNGIFTSCKINDNCPPWSIKAEKITHDKIKKDMIYKNAILKVYDVPILYFPKFFHPDPSVKRRSGFLQPQFNNSETLGSSLYIPYFKTLGPDKDLTIKPTFFEKLTKFEKEKYILQSEFRKKGKNSSLIADFAFLRDYKSLTGSKNKTKNINHLFLNYSNDLKNPNYVESKFEAQIEKVTNDTYLKVFQNNLFDTPVMPGNQSTMNSNIKLYLEKEDQNLTTGVEVYENLGIKHSDRYQYTLPYYDFSKNLTSLITDNSINGSLNFYSSGTNKLSNTNNLRTTVVNDFNYSSNDFISKLGFKNNFELYLKNLNSVGKNDSIYTSNAQIDGMSILKIDTSYPLIKSKNTVEETLTPKISFRVNPGNNMDNYSVSSKNISASSAFNLNRLGLSNDFEAGRSLTFGLDYKFDLLEDIQNEDVKNKFLELKLATVFRDQFENDIPISSTINKKNSDLFGSINSQLFDNINLTYDFSLDNDMKTINSNSIETKISINNFITTFNFIEQRNEIGSTHLLSNITEYQINDNTSLKFSTRRNKKINLTEYYDLSYEYKNDCLTAALKFNKSFYQDNDLKPTEDLFFSITLIPLTTYEREIYKKTPGQSGLKGWFR